jgi:hypothetical protein
MTTKLHSDEDRRAWLQLRQLTGERDRVADERDRLRRQLFGAIASGPAWPGEPLPELKARLETVTKAWHALLDEIQAVHDGNRPPPVISTPPPVIGGVLRTQVPVMRMRLR